MANVITIALLGYLKTAPIVEKTLVVPGLLMVFAIGFYLIRRTFPDKKEPALKLRLKSVESDVRLPEHIHPEEPQGYYCCEIEVENIGEITADDISVEIMSLELIQDIAHWPFPLPLQTSQEHDRTLNPGEKMKMLFMDSPRIVEVFGRRGVKGAIANHAGAYIMVDKDYRMTLRVIARDMAPPLLVNFVLKFIGERGMYAFTLIPSP